MTFIRSIGRWTMTGLVINGIIGSGIFGVPAELTHLLGRASPLAMVFAALGMAIIMAVITEVASQFSDPGGPYLTMDLRFTTSFPMITNTTKLTVKKTGTAETTTEAGIVVSKGQLRILKLSDSEPAK